jgi:hypothetical protein
MGTALKGWHEAPENNHEINDAARLQLYNSLPQWNDATKKKKKKQPEFFLV